MRCIEMPYDRRNDETGRFTPTYSSEDFLDALCEIEGGATTQEVRGHVGCAYRTAHAQLSELEERGQVTSHSVGRVKLWSLSESGDTENSNGSKSKSENTTSE